jgi:hypothetical protein
MDRQYLRLAAAALGLSAISACTASPARMLSGQQGPIRSRDVHSPLQQVRRPADDKDRAPRFAASLPPTPAASARPSSQPSSPPPLPWATKSKRTAEHWAAVPCNPTPFATAPVRTAIASTSKPRPKEAAGISDTAAPPLNQHNALSAGHATIEPGAPASVAHFVTQRPERIVRPAGGADSAAKVDDLPLQTAERSASALMPRAAELGAMSTAPVAGPRLGFLSGIKQTVHGDAGPENAAE